MKLKIFFLFLVAVAASSCEKLLEPDPNKSGFDLTNNSYTNFRGALQGINGIYSNIRPVYVNLYFLDEMSDDAFAGTNRVILDENRLDPFGAEASGTWGTAYSVIARTNIYLDRVPLITGLSPNEEILKKQFVAEAKVIRALMYFNLVRLFGDVPLAVTEQNQVDELQIPRVASNLVYAQIIKDLSEAIVDLPAAHPNNKLIQPVPASLNGGRERGRVTSILAKSVLGEVYLTTKDFPKADQFLSEALSDAAANGVTLNSNFNQAFEALSNLELTNESLFEIGFVPVGTLSGAQHNLSSAFGPPDDNASFGWDAPTDKSLQINAQLNNTLAQAFTTGDLRRASTIKYNSVEYPGSGFIPTTINAKYWQRGLQNRSTANWIVYRLADVILLAAEAKQAIGGQDPAALALLNQVHAHPRTGLAAFATGLSGNALRDAIRLERRVELAMEAKRYFDLLRWGTLTTVMAAHGFSVNPLKNGLLPIPQGERDKNPSLGAQNPGY